MAMLTRIVILMQNIRISSLSMVANTSRDTKAQLRLLQFLSPAMPVGAYSYSQGLEWAVEQGWITDEASFQQWVTELIACTLTLQELPLIRRLHRCFQSHDVAGLEHWSQTALAVRDTAESRQEELDRALAYLRVLEAIAAVQDEWPRHCFLRSPLVAMSYFSVDHGIGEESLSEAFAHNWLENMLITGVKIIPLGQSSAQKLLFELADQVIVALSSSQKVEDDEIGVSLPALSMACLLYTSPSPRDQRGSRMPSSA